MKVINYSIAASLLCCVALIKAMPLELHNTTPNAVTVRVIIDYKQQKDITVDGKGAKVVTEVPEHTHLKLCLVKGGMTYHCNRVFKHQEHGVGKYMFKIVPAGEGKAKIQGPIK